MSKHTPGPWFGYKDQGVYTDEEYESPIFETGCGCCSKNTLTEEDARLIAAAPELLEALQTMVKAFHTYAPKTEGAEYNCVINARAAIAKATGEQ